ncbi:MFS transporter small subunit [Solihabitans fulvus]|uniref:MFS transporter small subunit n=1 Tax=Solihabitans fulvus TaxID=1892852 RepID=UPI001661D68B|nr:hypothetical protein [Solihabitans fulvus]
MAEDETTTAPAEGAAPNRVALLVVAWLWVTLPFLYGLYKLIMNAQKLFQH